MTLLNKVKVGVVGGAGYTGGEVLRLLINHPCVELAFAHSNTYAGRYIHEIHTDLIGDTKMVFTHEIPPQADLLFLCVPHGEARRFLEMHLLNDGLKIIDLSQDFRLKEDSTIKRRHFVYGLPERYRASIKHAKNIANPGCFATAIQLGLLPLASNGLLTHDVHVHAVTGSSGAGQALTKTAHFTWRNNNVSTYKAFEHQHLAEIAEHLSFLEKGFAPLDKTTISWVPQRGNFTRGILATMYTNCHLSLKEAYDLYEGYYADHPFTHLSYENIDLKQVVNTNKALIHLEKHGNKLLITSIIDNLLKGASGQAVQNMNIMFGFNEMTGLKLKAIVF